MTSPEWGEGVGQILTKGREVMWTQLLARLVTNRKHSFQLFFVVLYTCSVLYQLVLPSRTHTAKRDQSQKRFPTVFCRAKSPMEAARIDPPPMGTQTPIDENHLKSNNFHGWASKFPREADQFWLPAWAFCPVKHSWKSFFTLISFTGTIRG